MPRPPLDNRAVSVEGCGPLLHTVLISYADCLGKDFHRWLKRGVGIHGVEHDGEGDACTSRPDKHASPYKTVMATMRLVQRRNPDAVHFTSALRATGAVSYTPAIVPCCA